MLRRALCHSVIAGSIIASTVILGLFDAVATDDGYEHYAEKPWTFLPKHFFIGKFRMPGNTFVNVGYFIVTVFWICHIYDECSRKKRITEKQAYMFYIFIWSSMLYAPVQVVRILTQNHRAAILDQWYTLPIFAWVTVWSNFIACGWNPASSLSIITVSSCSYCFTLLKIAGYEDKGFEVSLAIHILFAVISGWRIYRMYPSSKALRSVALGILCCIGFVGLKLADPHLGKFHPFFRVLSGHFWSKIADFMQIHYVCQFFLYITWEMNERKSLHKID